MKRIGVMALVLLAGWSLARSQAPFGTGFPFITNITADDYGAHVQNWGFTTDSNGILHAANLTGVMIWDGVRWEKTNIPNIRVFSVASDTAGRVYVGGLNEFGYLSDPVPERMEEDETGRYRSLRHLIPDTIEFSNIWEIITTPDDVIFKSYQHLFRYDGEEITIYPTSNRFISLFLRDDEVYVRESGRGVRIVGPDSLRQWSDGEFFAESTLQSYLKIGNLEFFCSFYECFTYSDNMFAPFETEADDYLQANYIDEAIALLDGTIAVATRSGGVVHLSATGELIRILDEANGLISNTVYGLFEDHNGTLWTATVNGISKVEMSAPFRRFDHRSGITEAISRMTTRNGEIFVSSAVGVYRISADGNARLLDAESTCRDFLHLGEELYVICTGGLYRYEGDRFSLITSNHFANFMALYESPSTIVAAHESGITVADIAGSKKKVHYRLSESGLHPESITVDRHKNIWIGTNTSGLYRIRLNKNNGVITGHSIERYLTDIENSNNDKRIEVTQLCGDAAFLTWGMGIQRYDHENDTLFMDTSFGEMFTDPERQIFWANEDHDGNVWFRSDRSYQAAMAQPDGSYEIYEGALRRIDDRQSNAIYPDPDGFVWFITDRGLIRYDTRHSFDHTRTFHTATRHVLVRGDSLVGWEGQDNPVVLDYKDNELRFIYAATVYDAPRYTEYRVKMEGFDSDWSAWTDETQKDYTNIPEGTYRFLVEARNVYGTVSAAAPYTLTVLPPWYRTWWAYLLYILITGSILYTAYRIRLQQLLKVERIRNNIAGDLHDEISATLSSISFFARAIEDDKIRGDKKRFVSLISQSAGEAKEKITDIVWAINPEHDDWKSFLSKCRRFTSDLLESGGIAYSLKIDKHIPGKMKMQFRQHLWMIYKEMITNVVRHSGAKRVDVIMNASGSRLTLIVQDNGNGMKKTKSEYGNGLANIRRRSELIGGTVSLETDTGSGTRWKLVVRI